MVVVPDARYETAVRLCQPKKRVPATLEIVDGAARVEVHERGSRFGTDFFAGLRAMDALVVVLRGFTNPMASEPADPLQELRSVEDELLLADLTVLEGRLERLHKQGARRQPGSAVEEQAIVGMLQHLESSLPLRGLDMTPEQAQVARAFALVSAKPAILVLNVDEQDLHAEAEIRSSILSYANPNKLPVMVLCARLEAEIAQMPPDEEGAYLAALGVREAARDALIRVAYTYMGLISFLTVGADEVRAWTIRNGTTALGAAEKIHSDIARTFIRAEVMEFADFEAAGGWDEARSAGKMRLEGKDYIVQDGQIVHIRNSRG